jgi:hypothetical protein
VVVFPFAFHIAVQQPFRPLWSRLLLHNHEPSRASFALCFMSLLMSLLPASGEFLFGFPSPRHLSSSGSYPFDLSGLGDPTGSNATAGLALRVTGTHTPLYHGKVKIPTKRNSYYSFTNTTCGLKLSFAPLPQTRSQSLQFTLASRTVIKSHRLSTAKQCYAVSQMGHTPQSCKTHDNTFWQDSYVNQYASRCSDVTQKCQHALPLYFAQSQE